MLDLPHEESILIEEEIQNLPDPKTSLTLDQYFEKMNVNKNRNLNIQTKGFENPRDFGNGNESPEPRA